MTNNDFKCAQALKYAGPTQVERENPKRCLPTGSVVYFLFFRTTNTGELYKIADVYHFYSKRAWTVRLEELEKCDHAELYNINENAFNNYNDFVDQLSQTQKSPNENKDFINKNKLYELIGWITGFEYGLSNYDVSTDIHEKRIEIIIKKLTAMVEGY